MESELTCRKRVYRMWALCVVTTGPSAGPSAGLSTGPSTGSLLISPTRPVKLSPLRSYRFYLRNNLLRRVNVQFHIYQFFTWKV